MDYHEAADFLFDLRRFAVRPGTESTAALRAAVGDPGEDLPFVQIAGSNGKGSTAKMVESILRESGLSVGLYSSPHLTSLDERVQVDGRPITASAVTEFVDEVRPWLIDRAADGDPLTFFEVITVMGIWYFDREDVDIAVLEVGLGGEYDATSVVDPVASCVTTVTLEHTDVLGDTIEEIATTKAKIAPDGATPLVTGATGAAREAVGAEAGDLLTVGIVGGEAVDCTVSYDGRVNHTEARVGIELPSVDRGPWPTLDASKLEVKLPLLGEHQALNAGIATVLAGQAVGSLADSAAVDFDAEAIGRGLRNAHWPGRFEVMSDDPLVVLDGAHNPEATATLAETLSTFAYDDLHLVFGAMHDKQHGAMVETLPTPDSVVTCRPNLSRAEDPAVLARVFENAGVDDVTAGASVADAFAAAREHTGPDDCLLVCGSLFAVGEARTTMTRRAVPKQVGDTETARTVLSNAHVPGTEIPVESERAVHAVMSMQVEGRQAAVLGRELRSLGGNCANSGVTAAGELHDVVLMGTVDQFRALADSLDGQPFGLRGIAAEIREQVGLTADSADSQRYPWDEGTAVMGILNVTPDSFHDGGDFFDREAAIAGAKTLIEEGADIIDIGGESTRPGADPVSVEDEIQRVVPVIEAVSDLDVWISVDTRKAAVAEAALDAGADILNDVAGLEDPAMRFLAADRGVPVIVMHSIDTPVVPDRDVDYEDVVEDVIRALDERVLLAEKAGIPRERIVVDPGLGFGKTAAESFELLGRLDEFDALGCPVLVGHSHKSMFDHVDRTPEDRLDATVAATALAADRGADIVRVHDVAENRAAVDVQQATDEPRDE